jgi:hypothetical protein
MPRANRYFLPGPGYVWHITHLNSSWFHIRSSRSIVSLRSKRLTPNGGSKFQVQEFK